MPVFSFVSRTLSTREQKVTTYDREKCAVTISLTVNEFLIIGSKFQNKLFTDQNSLLFHFTRKSNLTPRQNKAHKLLTQISELQNIHTSGTNSTIVDMLSRGFSNVNTNRRHLERKTFPPHIDFLPLQHNYSLKSICHLEKQEKRHLP